LAIATNGAVGSTSIPGAPPNGGQAPNLVKALKGQGAQWQQMGRKLIRISSIFRRSIKALDVHLVSLEAIPWAIKEELVNPAGMSRVNKAELFQPLCIALQTVLVDTSAAVGLRLQQLLATQVVRLQLHMPRVR
jgi:acyl transferase domain-containing protein